MRALEVLNLGQPRPPEPLHMDGGFYFLILSSDSSSGLFSESEDYRIFNVLLARACQHCRCTLIASSLLPKKAYLFVQITEICALEFARFLVLRYTIKSNERYAHAARRITDYEYLRVDGMMGRDGLIAYIHHTPVRAGLVTHPADWPWNGPRPEETRNDKIAQAAAGERNFEALQRRRWQALRMHRDKKSCSEIARELNVSTRAVQIWVKVFKLKGRQGLRLNRPQAQSMLKPEEHAELLQLLSAAPTDSSSRGARSAAWTGPQVVRLIQERFGVTYTRSGVWYLMRRLGVPTSSNAAKSDPEH
jgi:transposase